MNPVGEGTWDRRRWLALLLLPMLVAAALYLPGIGRRLIYAGDEARYAILARTMLETGDWLVPRLSGEVRMAKNPLFIWSIRVPARRQGDRVDRLLPAALCGIAGVGDVLWRAGCLARGRRSSPDSSSRRPGVLLVARTALAT
jgi:4-amino-4-deoxy-L-arabinose transferase-like glycosyltransferase